MERTISYNSNRKGFTLAEVLIVVAIVAILAGVSVPLFSAALKSYQLKQVTIRRQLPKQLLYLRFIPGMIAKEMKLGFLTLEYVLSFMMQRTILFMF